MAASDAPLSNEIYWFLALLFDAGSGQAALLIKRS